MERRPSTHPVTDGAIGRSRPIPTATPKRGSDTTEFIREEIFDRGNPTLLDILGREIRESADETGERQRESESG